MPDPETTQRLLANLRKTHLKMQECNLELDQIEAQLADFNLKQRSQRVK